MKNPMLKTMFIFTMMTILTSPLFGFDKRDLAPFHKIEINGAFKVTLEQGDKEQVEVVIDSSKQDAVVTEVVDGTLKVYTKKAIKSFETVYITIRMKKIDEIHCSGAVKLTTPGGLNLDELSLNLDGATDCTISVKLNTLDIKMDGTSSLMVTGSATTANINIRGTGKISAPALETDQCAIEIAGAGYASLNVKTKLDVNIAGTGFVEYKGEPSVNKTITGLGKIKKV